MKLGMRELWPLLGPSGPSVHLLLLVAACVFCLLSSLGKLLVHCNFPWQLHQDPCCEGCHSFTVEAKHLFSCTETLWKMLLLLASTASLYQLHVWSLYLWTVFCIGHNHPSILFYHCHHWVHLSYHCPSYCCFPRFLWYVFFCPYFSFPPLLSAHIQPLELVTHPDLTFSLDQSYLPDSSLSRQSFTVLDSPYLTDLTVYPPPYQCSLL